MPPCDQFPECHSVPTPFRQLLRAVFITSVRKKRVTSIEPRVQFPPPPSQGTCENSQVPFSIEFTTFHSTPKDAGKQPAALEYIKLPTFIVNISPITT